MLSYIKKMKDHYRGHSVSYARNEDGSYTITINLKIGGVDDSTMQEIAQFLDVLITGLSKGKLVIPITRKDKEKMMESVKKIEKSRLKAFLNAKKWFIEGVENE